MTRLPIKGYEGLYEVSEEGKVYSVDRIIFGQNGKDYSKRGQCIRPTIHKNTGYLIVSLWKHSCRVTCYVHRLVATAFIPNPENKPEVNHKDSSRINPHATNLEWVTRSENMLHGYAEGYCYCPKKQSEIQLAEALAAFLEGVTLTRLAKQANVGLSRLAINLRQLAKKQGIEDKFDYEISCQRAIRNKQANAAKQQEICCYFLDGTLQGVYPSLTTATKALGKKSSGTISNALNPNKKQETAYGYKWEYKL